jgi:Putative Phosphatase
MQSHGTLFKDDCKLSGRNLCKGKVMEEYLASVQQVPVFTFVKLQ